MLYAIKNIFITKNIMEDIELIRIKMQSFAVGQSHHKYHSIVTITITAVINIIII